MKRICYMLLALLMVMLCACGPGDEPVPSADPSPSPSVSAEPTPSESNTPEPSETPSYTNPLTGEPTEEDTSNQRPVAIMLNNIKAAMPQHGNSQADIIYEVLAEGGITRMVGVYHDISGLGTVGSIRSARLYYLELAMGHDAIYVHAGGSPEAVEYISKWNATNINANTGAGGSAFWRDRERVEGHYYAYEHSLLTSGEKLTAHIDSSSYITREHREGYTYEMTFAADGTPADGQSASTVVVPFSSKATTFHYDESTGLYQAEQYGTAFIDGNDGSQIAVTNLLILRTECKVIDDAGRLEVDLSSGEGWFACGGKLIPITWEKGSYDQQLRYYTLDGQPLTLGQGKSYVGIIPLGKEITAE